MDKYENEVELMDYFKALRKRKWLIIIPTLFCVLAAGVISFLLPLKWEIDILIIPGKISLKTASGRFEEVVVVDPKQIAGQINQLAYNQEIAAELNMEIREFPRLRAENIIDTGLIRVSVRQTDIEKAKLILNSLFVRLKSELDGKASIELKEIDSEISSNEIKKARIEEEIKTFRHKFTIVKQRKKEIEKEVMETKKKIELLEKEQQLSLKKGSKSELENLVLLLYSNVIQQTLQHYNYLTRLLNNNRIEEENINLEMLVREENIRQIVNDIENLNERKGRIDFTKLIKQPTVSLRPVAPRKIFNLVIAGVLGLIIFTVLAFFFDYIEKQKAKS